MDPEEFVNLQTRRRLAKLFKIPPFRIDVEVDMTNRRIRVSIDGEPIDQEKRAILEKDVRESTQAFREKVAN